MEEWKDIYYFDTVKNEWVDYRGLYQVSSEGRVKSLNYRRTRQERILKTRYNKQGYLQVSLHKNGKGKNFRIHRLVAFAFIENNSPLIKTEVNHKDENKMNNCVENLEWCNREYNNNYGTRNERASKSMSGKNSPMYGRTGENHHNSKAVICITTGTIYGSISEASRLTGIAQANISANCSGTRKSAGKDENEEPLVWMYLENYEKMEKFRF